MRKSRKSVSPQRNRKAPVKEKARACGGRTGFNLGAEELEQALLTGDSRGLVEDYFGEENYAELCDLARQSTMRSVRGGPRVLILPGIMGSTLSKKGLLGVDDVLWLDPVKIAAGALMNLKLGRGSSPYRASDVILLAYLKLKLRLRIAGFNADFCAYDWRRSLAELGRAVAKTIQQDASPHVSLVAHSMGGLVARAALSTTGDKVARLIMLGTPNSGSFAPVQVVRGTYDVVQRLAQVDLRHDVEELCGQVFNTFPGLYEMLPAPDKFSGINLYDATAWPKSGPQPSANLLAAVKTVIGQLAPPDDRFYLIAGVNQETVTGLQTKDGEFVYELSQDGDGTVPVEFAHLAGIPGDHIYYVEESHGSLPNNGAVGAAVADLLSTGVTSAVSNNRPAPRRAAAVLTEKDLMARSPAVNGQLGVANYRHLLDAVAAPPRAKGEGSEMAPGLTDAGGASKAESGAPKQRFQGLTIERRRQRQIELTLAQGSITEVESRAYVLGVFRNVAPSGAAKSIDDKLNGAITEFTVRRMFSGDAGTVFTLPVGRGQLAADMVVLAGMGAFDRFNSEVQELMAENVARVLARSRVDEFATILIGAGSGQSVGLAMENLLTGFFRGLKDADPRNRLRGITLCETDPARYAEMRDEAFRLAATSMFDDIELTLGEAELPPMPAATSRVTAAGPEPVYLMVRQEGETRSLLHYRISILGSGMKAAVVSAARDVDAKQLAKLLEQFDAAVGPDSNFQDVQQYGVQFCNLTLPAEVRTVLSSLKDRHLAVVHDAPAARIPWETLTLDGWSPATRGGLSRRYQADHLRVATWLEERRRKPTLKLLLIANPLGDLGGAEKEADRIMAMASATTGLEVVQMRRKDASRSAILAALRSGQYDCVHYAGHAFFDPQGPSRSGLICAGKEILRGGDLTGISNLPLLVFFNACEAGRVRGGRAAPVEAASKQVMESAGIAEALMYGGVANYLSTYWPVGDQSAEVFAGIFYKSVLAGGTLGSALLEGRKAVLALKQRDWADYILYGNYDFVLKQRG